MVDEIAAEHVREAWHRLPKLHKLSPREMAVVRELSLWREAEAVHRNRPPRRILRDDLILELARRQPKTIDDLFATRDMNRGDLRARPKKSSAGVERAAGDPGGDLPPPPRPAGMESDSDEHVVGQLLGIALMNQCTALNVAKTLVGTSADLRDLVRWHQSRRKGNCRRESCRAGGPKSAATCCGRAQRKNRPPRGRQQLRPSPRFRADRRTPPAIRGNDGGRAGCRNRATPVSRLRRLEFMGGMPTSQLSSPKSALSGHVIGDPVESAWPPSAVDMAPNAHAGTAAIVVPRAGGLHLRGPPG